jgi:hypothetical protein
LTRVKKCVILSMAEIIVDTGVTIEVDSDFFDKYWWANYSHDAKTKQIQIYIGKKLGGRARGWALLHRFVKGLKNGDPREVHHKNGNYDFRSESLEIVTPEQHKAYRPNKYSLRYFCKDRHSGYRGNVHLGYGPNLERAKEKHMKAMALLEAHKEEIGYKFYGYNCGTKIKKVAS